MDQPNVADLAIAMRQLQEDYGLGSVSVTMRLPTILLTATVVGPDIFTLEDDRGNVVMGEVPT